MEDLADDGEKLVSSDVTQPSDYQLSSKPQHLSEISVVEDFFSFPRNAANHDRHDELFLHATPERTLRLYVGYQIFLFVFMFFIVLPDAPGSLGRWYLASFGFFSYSSLITAFFFFNMWTQHACFSYMGGKANIALHAYLTVLPTGWLIAILTIFLLIVGFFSREYLGVCLLSVIFIGVNLYFLYLYLFTLSYAHDLEDYQVVIAFIFSCLVGAPTIVTMPLFTRLLIETPWWGNLLVAIISTTFVVVAFRYMQHYKAQSQEDISQ